MATANDRKVESDSLRVQLAQLNERSRWYSSQLWQMPFAFLGIVALAVGAVIDQNTTVVGSTFLAIGGFGIAVFIHILGLADGERRAVLNIQKIEEQLDLEQTALYSPKIWFPFQVVVMVVIVACFLLGIYFLVVG